MSGTHADTWDVPTMGSPSAAALAPYHAVIWFTGFPVEWVRSVEGRADLLGPMLRWAI